MASAPAHQETVSATTESNVINEKLSKIKNLHDEAHLYISQGLSCDEQGQGEQAVTLYMKGISCIDTAVDLNRALPEHARRHEKLIQKMRQNKEQVMGRVEALLATDTQTAMAISDPPPSYEAATTPSDASETFADALDNSNRLAFQQDNATELFKITEGVQMYFITPEGYVSAPSYPTSLGIYILNEQQPNTSTNDSHANAFLKVGEWTYPLLPGCSPVLQTTWASYIFPDVNNQQEGSTVGIIIPDTVPEQERAQLESILLELTALRSQVGQAPQREPGSAHPDEEQTSTKIARGIVDTAEWIAVGLGKGAEKTGELLRKGTTKLKENMNPESEPTRIGPKTQQGVYYAKKASGAAVTVSAFVITQLGKATMALGRQAAPHIRKQGEKYLPQVFKSDESGKSKMDGVVEVTAGGITAFSTVFVGLERAAKVLAKNMADGTVDVVGHKYGDDAGKLTHNALYTTGNLALTGYNINNLGVKAIAKRAAKDTGKAVVEDYQKEKTAPTGGVVAPGEKRRRDDQDDPRHLS